MKNKQYILVSFFFVCLQCILPSAWANINETTTGQFTTNSYNIAPQYPVPQYAGSQGFGSQGVGNAPQNMVINSGASGVSATQTFNSPAWAQSAYQFPYSTTLEPFGANLFRGHFSASYSADTNAQYTVQAGDRILIRIWGARTFESVLVVDQQGNIFLPEIGPLQVAGLPHSSLDANIRKKISEVYTDNVNSYVNLQTAQPVSVYVTGFVKQPGRYAGGTQDTVLSYLDRAGGILADRGSYRHIRVKRGSRIIADVDLYAFILEGVLPKMRIQDGDVIIVSEIQNQVSAQGGLSQSALYELEKEAKGKELIRLASPSPSVSHVSFSGLRNAEPVNKYYSLQEFAEISLQDGDKVNFVSDTQSTNMIVAVKGAILGASHFPIKKSTTLKDLLPYIAVDPELADTSAIYILRHSIAEQQKVILQETLQRLEQSALTATSSTESEASIRVQEAALIQDYVKRASEIKPTGLLVVYNEGEQQNTLLEPQDIVVIPQKTNVVHVTGEVMIARAILWKKNMKLNDYIQNAGGYSNRANKKDVLVVRMNGEIGQVADMGINPGDRILVMPKFATKNLEFLKSITQILYQIAVATKVALDL